MKKRLVLVLTGIIALAMILAGCGGSDNGGASEEATADGPIVIGCSYVAGNTNPVDSAWDLTSHGISEGIYMQDAEGNLVSRFVSKLERKDDLTWKAELTNAVKFSDGSDCDAKALADCMNYLQKNNEMANGTAGVVKFTAEDDGTLTIVTERPTPVMDSLLAEWCNVVFKEVDGDFIYTGPYMVKKLDSEVSLEMEPNPYYDDRAEQRSDVTLKVFSDAAAMQQAFEAKEIDLMFGLTPEVAETLKGEGFTVKDFDAGYQYFGFTNVKKGPMADVNVRKAINLILNREDMVTALKAGRVANGIFAQYYSFAGDVEEKTDVAEAAKLLEGAGYSKNADGIYEKDGKKLSIHMVTYSARADLPILMQLSASELTEAGIESKTDIVDDINASLEGGDYDLVFYAQHTAPSGEPSAFLNMALAEGGSRNYAGYNNDKINDLLKKMGETEPGADRDQLSKDIQKIVAEELPIIYMVDPQWHVALSERVANYEPYCGDYYTVNAELGL